MRTILSLAIITAFLATGCQNATVIQTDTPAVESVSYITAEEFTATVAGEGDVVLVEFCVPIGCFRCDQMREQIDRLASNERERLTIRRVNLNQQPALARQLGVSVCPSYIAFRHGEEVFRVAYPTSSDLIVAGLNESLRNSSAE